MGEQTEKAGVGVGVNAEEEEWPTKKWAEHDGNERCIG